MTQDGVSFRDLPMLQRMRRFARVSLVFSVFGLPLYFFAFSGGRFQIDHGSVTDMWLLAVLYPVGLFLSGIVGALFSGWWSNRRMAALAAGISVLPLFGLISVAAEHSGPTAPYRVVWRLTIACSALTAVIVATMYTDLVRRFEAARERTRQRRAPAA